MSNYSKIIEEEDCSHIIKRVGSSLDYLKNKSLLNMEQTVFCVAILLM